MKTQQHFLECEMFRALRQQTNVTGQVQTFNLTFKIFISVSG